jgi:hypothetical protein
MNLASSNLFINGLFNEAINSSVYAGIPSAHSGLSEEFFGAPQQGQTSLKIFNIKFLLICKETQKYALL